MLLLWTNESERTTHVYQEYDSHNKLKIVPRSMNVL
jgi:hypothetical protein